MVGDKLRFRFEKSHDLRLLSHHDLMRCAERMMRRADLPIKMTQGFHPAPRIVFALSLTLGVVGRNEVLELELTEPRDADETLHLLRQHAPAGLIFHSVQVVRMKASAVPRRMVYQIPVPSERIAEVERIANELMASEEVWVDRHHPRPRQVNIRPYLRSICVEPVVASEERGVRSQEKNTDAFRQNSSLVTPHSSLATNVSRLTIDIWVTGTGTARADELLNLLGIADLLDDGHILERAELELHDETPDAPDGPPTGPSITRPLSGQPPAGRPSASGQKHSLSTLPNDEEPSTTATWGLSPNGPVVE